MMWYLKLYMRFCSQYLKILMQSKLNFFIGLSSFLVIQATGILFLDMIFSQIKELNGWSFNQILFIYGFSLLPRGLDHLFADYIWILGWRVIIRGEFDRYLLRPINPLFHLLSERFQPDAFGELLVGIVITTIAASRLNITITVLSVLIFIILIFAGAVIYTSVKLFFASIAFWIKNSSRLMQFSYMISDFAKYPIQIYGRAVQAVITVIIPFAFTAFIPAAYFTGKTELTLALGGTVLVAVVTFTIAYMTWLKGMRAYESAGN